MTVSSVEVFCRSAIIHIHTSICVCLMEELKFSFCHLDDSYACAIRILNSIVKMRFLAAGISLSVTYLKNCDM